MKKIAAAEKHADSTADLARKIDLILVHLGITDPTTAITPEEAARIDEAAASSAAAGSVPTEAVEPPNPPATGDTASPRRGRPPKNGHEHISG